MKINIEKLNVKKTPEYATNTEIIDMQPETNLERTWNYLAKYYTYKEDEKEMSQLKKLFENFYFAGIEIETCKNAFDLTTQNVIKEVKTKKNNEINEYTLKTKVLDDLISITNRKKKLLIDSIEKENKIYELVKNENVYMKNNRLKIWIDLKHELDCTSGVIKKPEKWTSKGLYCKIKYKNLVFEGFYMKSGLDCVEDVKEYIREIRLEGKYKYNEYKITIKRGEGKKVIKENSLCRLVIDCIDVGVQKEKLHEMMLEYTSKYLLLAFLRANEITKYTIAKDDSILFCIFDKGVVKVYNKNGHIVLFMNEKQIEYRI